MIDAKEKLYYSYAFWIILIYLMNSNTYLAKRKQKKQVELDKCAFDPEHMEESHNGGSFPMVNFEYFSVMFFYFYVFDTVWKNKVFSETHDEGKPRTSRCDERTGF